MAGSDNFINEYLNSRHFNVLLRSDAHEYDAAAKALCSELKYHGGKAIKNCKILLCNLVIIHSRSLSKYMSISISPNSYIQNRYNPNCVGYRPIDKLIDLLVEHEYIEYKKGYKKFKYKTGYYARIRPTLKLIVLFGKYGLKAEMVKPSPNEEVLVLKGMTVKVSVYQKGADGKIRSRKVNLAKLEDYYSTDYLDRKRAVIVRYNELLKKSYIDIDEEGYTVKASRKEDIVIDLANKRTRRIFNNENFKFGGRFYGGWWQSIPSDLRKRIIINGHNIVEIDFSGMHIHIMYAMEGLKLDKEPYVVPKDNDPQCLRPVYKQIMLVAINCDDDDTCVEVVKKHIKSNPEDFADHIVNNATDEYVKKLLNKLKAYHADISKYINTGIGLEAQYIDSEIASEVINTMTKMDIPVLCVHDSFICSYKHEDVLLNEMARAYIKILNREHISKYDYDLTLRTEDVKTDLKTLIHRLREPWFSAHALRTISTSAKQGHATPAASMINYKEYITGSKPVMNCDTSEADISLFFASADSVSNKQVQRYMNYRAEGKQTFSTCIVIKKQRITKSSVEQTITSDTCVKDTSV